MRCFLLAVVGSLGLAGSIWAADGATDLAIIGALRAHAAATPSLDGTMVGIAVPNSGPLPQGAPTFQANFVVTGPVPPLNKTVKIPCANCVGNPKINPSLGLTGALGYIPTTLTHIQHTVVFQDISYTGNCQVSFALMQGSNVIDQHSATGPANPNTLYFVYFDRARSPITGPATVVGTVQCGTPIETVTTSLYFQ